MNRTVQQKQNVQKNKKVFFLWSKCRFEITSFCLLHTIFSKQQAPNFIKLSIQHTIGKNKCLIYNHICNIHNIYTIDAKNVICCPSKNFKTFIAQDSFILVGPPKDVLHLAPCPLRQFM